jgi:3-hydroxyacyl-[acyl-carrier-protein] dehydratase
MRWFWIERYVEFERGRRAVAIKNVSLAEEELDDYTPGYPVMPNSLIIEGMAQTAGLLIGEASGFEARVILAKIGKAIFHRYAIPGDSLRYTATIVDTNAEGAMATVTSHIGDELQAEVEFMFAFITDKSFSGGPLFEPVDFVAMIRGFRIYEVGRDQEGKPLQLPEFYAQAQREAEASYAPIGTPVSPHEPEASARA